MKFKNKEVKNDTIDKVFELKERMDIIISYLEKLNRKLLNESKNSIVDPNKVMNAESKFQQILQEYNNLKMESFLTLYEDIYDVKKEYFENGEIDENRLERILKGIKKQTYLSGYKIIYPNGNDNFDEEMMETPTNDYSSEDNYIVSNTLRAGYSYTNYRQEETVKRLAIVNVKEFHDADINQFNNEEEDKELFEKFKDLDESQEANENFKEDDLKNEIDNNNIVEKKGIEIILRDINQKKPTIDNIIINLDYGKESKYSICCVANTINFSIQLFDKTEEVKREVKKKRNDG